MDYSAILESIAKLGPAIAAILGITIITYLLIQLFSRVMSKLLDMFSQHANALLAVEKNMNAHTVSVNRMSENVDANTRATIKLIERLDNKV